ncbi:MAG: DUF515 domain-containing protein [Methanobacteriaceae archaeon]|nr:DUF515 domain-containing protein [Methanobacteriaceae archaeon]
MLDKILGKKKNEKDSPPNLKKNGKSDSDMGERLKGVVGKITGKGGSGKKDEPEKGSEKKPSARMGKPMPKPRIKPRDKPKLKTPPQKPGGIKKPGGIGRRVPEEDQRTLIGAAVFGIILIVIVGAGYYFLVYQPYQETLNAAKTTKFNEVDAYFKDALALYPEKQSLLAQIDAAVTPEEALAVDVLGPATAAWREYQTQQLKEKRDNYGRIMIVYNADEQKNVIMKVDTAQKFIQQADATVLANMELQTPDTVAVPIIITRLQAAGGLVTVGNMVDVYLRTTAEGNNTTTTTNTTSPKISGATVLAILRAKDSGVVDAYITRSQDISINQMIQSSAQNQKATNDVEQLLRAAASRNWNEAEINSLLESYGWRLSDFERASNLGELDAQYLVLLEVPREDVGFLIQNMDSVILTVPTQQAPTWMSKELQRIYG